MTVSEFCHACRKMQISIERRYPSGTEFVCQVCGHQIDFLHDEEDEEPEDAGSHYEEEDFEDFQA